MNKRCALNAWRTGSSLAPGSGFQRMIESGNSQQEVLGAKLTAPYDASVAGALDLALGVTTSDRFVSTLYAELLAAG